MVYQHAQEHLLAGRVCAWPDAATCPPRANSERVTTIPLEQSGRQ
jgi:hypothetical protein